MVIGSTYENFFHFSSSLSQHICLTSFTRNTLTSIVQKFQNYQQRVSFIVIEDDIQEQELFGEILESGSRS
jgi:hypothetical protein